MGGLPFQSIVFDSDFYGHTCRQFTPDNEFPFRSTKLSCLMKAPTQQAEKSNNVPTKASGVWKASVDAKRGKWARVESFVFSLPSLIFPFSVWKLSKSFPLRLATVRTHTETLFPFRNGRKAFGRPWGQPWTSKARRGEKLKIHSRRIMLSHLFLFGFFHPPLRQAGLHGSLSNKPSLVLMISKTIRSAHLFVWINKQQQREWKRKLYDNVGREAVRCRLSSHRQPQHKRHYL